MAKGLSKELLKYAEEYLRPLDIIRNRKHHTCFEFTNPKGFNFNLEFRLLTKYGLAISPTLNFHIEKIELRLQALKESEYEGLTYLDNLGYFLSSKTNVTVEFKTIDDLPKLIEILNDFKTEVFPYLVNFDDLSLEALLKCSTHLHPPFSLIWMPRLIVLFELQGRVEEALRYANLMSAQVEGKADAFSGDIRAFIKNINDAHKPH